MNILRVDSDRPLWASTLTRCGACPCPRAAPQLPLQPRRQRWCAPEARRWYVKQRAGSTPGAHCCGCAAGACWLDVRRLLASCSSLDASPVLLPGELPRQYPGRSGLNGPAPPPPPPPPHPHPHPPPHTHLPLTSTVEPGPTCRLALHQPSPSTPQSSPTSPSAARPSAALPPPTPRPSCSERRPGSHMGSRPDPSARCSSPL